MPNLGAAWGIILLMKAKVPRLHRIAICLFWLGALPAIAQQGPDVELDRVLRQMGEAGGRFVSFQADFVQRKYTAILRDFDHPETGEFIYSRAKDGSALLRQEVRQPGSKILTIKGGTAVVYQPMLKQAQVVSLGKNRDKAEYLALGLGQSPAKLKETFEIRYAGTETIDGAKCSILILQPKSSAAAAFFSSITLWIKAGSAVPIQQKLMEPNGDYLMVKFSGEKLNLRIADGKFEQKLPKDVEIQRIQ